MGETTPARARLVDGKLTLAEEEIIRATRQIEGRDFAGWRVRHGATSG
jgi:hypothetical protein